MSTAKVITVTRCKSQKQRHLGYKRTSSDSGN